MIRTTDQSTKNTSRRSMTATLEPNYSCYIHKSNGHSTLNCRSFARLTVQEKFDLCRKEKLCFRCLSRHGRNECAGQPCQTCGKSHHTSMCPRNPHTNPAQLSPSMPIRDPDAHVQIDGYACSSLSSPAAVLPLSRVQVKAEPNTSALALFDSGSDASYITFSFANKIGIKPVRKLKLHVTTMGNVATSDFHVHISLSDPVD